MSNELQIDKRHREMLLQLIRYGISGVGVTTAGVLVYNALVASKLSAPMVAQVLAFLVSVSIGYTVHSQWSFKGHGENANKARQTLRFLIVALFSLILNEGWTAFLIYQLHLPRWTPTVPMVAITPIMLFWLNRNWVFR